MRLQLVHVTQHALDRALLRFPEVEREHLRQLIVADVRSAMTEGRYSSRCPAFAAIEGRRPLGRRNGGKERDRSLRYVWDTSETRIYLIDKRGQTVNVVTSIGSADKSHDQHGGSPH